MSNVELGPSVFLKKAEIRFNGPFFDLYIECRRLCLDLDAAAPPKLTKITHELRTTLWIMEILDLVSSSTGLNFNNFEESICGLHDQCEMLTKLIHLIRPSQICSSASEDIFDAQAVDVGFLDLERVLRVLRCTILMKIFTALLYESITYQLF